MCSIIGRLAMGSMAFCWLDVSGRRRLPSPPAMITAFTAHPRRNPHLRGYCRAPSGPAGPAVRAARPSANAARANGM